MNVFRQETQSRSVFSGKSPSYWGTSQMGVYLGNALVDIEVPGQRSARRGTNADADSDYSKKERRHQQHRIDTKQPTLHQLLTR